MEARRFPSQESVLSHEPERVLSQMFSWYLPASEKKCWKAEQDLLNCVSVPIEQKLVPVSGHYLNTLEMGSHIDGKDAAALNKTMVILPGFGAGVGFFFKNFQAFAEHPGLKTYAVDWLGTGRSSRVPFNIKPGAEGSVEAAENFFVDSLEEWRQQMGIEKMVLFGHSLGGYLSACYALKYPQRVEHLFLISPAGIPKQPVISPEEQKEMDKETPFVWSVVKHFWERHYTPQDFLRFIGPFGHSLAQKFVDRRFSNLTEKEAIALRDYGYQINIRKGSGEYAVHCLLGVGAWARNPLIDRFPKLTVPTTQLYGSHDWMDSKAGRYASTLINAPSSFGIVRGAGHHLYLDQPEDFNENILRKIGELQGLVR